MVKELSQDEPLRQSSSNVRGSIVKLTAMTDPDNGHFLLCVIYLIADAPVADADTPNTFFTFDFETPGGARIRTKREDGCHYAVLDGSVEPLQFALGA